MAPALKDTSTDEIERWLDEIQPHGYGGQRSNVLTHVAWVPPQWSRAATRVLEGLGARHPSRTIMLHPDPKAAADRIDAQVDHDCFGEGERLLCVEVIHIWLRGETAHAPASVVVPLQLPDLPAFLRWRGKPPFGRPEFEQLIGVSDRLIVDSSEWGDGLPARSGAWPSVFGRVAVSDLAWARAMRWRIALAALWPGSVRRARCAWRVRRPRRCSSQAGSDRACDGTSRCAARPRRRSRASRSTARPSRLRGCRR